MLKARLVATALAFGMCVASSVSALAQADAPALVVIVADSDVARPEHAVGWLRREPA